MTSRGDREVPPVILSLGAWTIWQLDGMLPIAYKECYCSGAGLVEEFDLKGPGCLWFCAASIDNANTPQLVVTQRYEPGPEAGFGTGVLVAPESSAVFLGAGERLLCYSMEDPKRPKRLWEDVADCGFWGWKRVGDTLLMCAELELAAFTLFGVKLWSTFVEPPWKVEANQRGDLSLDVMGRVSEFPAKSGPPRLL